MFTRTVCINPYMFIETTYTQAKLHLFQRIILEKFNGICGVFTVSSRCKPDYAVPLNAQRFDLIRSRMMPIGRFVNW